MISLENSRNKLRKQVDELLEHQNQLRNQLRHAESERDLFFEELNKMNVGRYYLTVLSFNFLILIVSF